MKSAIEEVRSVVEEVFDHLHKNPEISWKEFETTNYLQGLMEKEGFDVTTFDDTTGLVVNVGSGGKCVGIRADIDALWQEVDGVYQANHSCGHDAHMTIGVGVMLVLKKLGYPKEGRLKAIFQPAEEKGKGALAFVEKGIVDDVDYLYGVHLRPIQEIGHGYSSPAIMHGSAKMVSGTITGTDTHGARPHLGENAIEVGSLLVQGLKAIHLDPMVPHSVKMTMFQAGGESANIIPGNAVFSLDLRAQTNTVMIELMNKVKKVVRSVAAMTGVEIDYEIGSEIAAAEVDEAAVEMMAQAITETVGEEYLTEPIVTPGGEDFHYYTLKRPNVKATMLGLGCDLSPGLHHPKMTFNKESIVTGIEILARAVILSFERIEEEGVFT
ncbi:M20 peptidase aminoacylase family protein [Sporosarcina siberiensis]|uniref:M20 peptidase aminoacylase family protein n=1 Tax=Sporosarcina siberiensis TaxID=1365606 RepID=A0ABW4SBF5_9BACL